MGFELYSLKLKAVAKIKFNSAKDDELFQDKCAFSAQTISFLDRSYSYLAKLPKETIISLEYKDTFCLENLKFPLVKSFFYNLPSLYEYIEKNKKIVVTYIKPYVLKTNFFHLVSVSSVSKVVKKIKEYSSLKFIALVYITVSHIYWGYASVN
jgi:hypothetical protein